MRLDPNDHVFHRNFMKEYPIIERGEGPYMYDSNGKKYICASGESAVVTIGHAVPEIIDAMVEQARKICFCHTSRFETEPLRTYANRVASYAPSDLDYVYLVTSGSDANEAALKLARQHHLNFDHRNKVVAIGRWQSYHGVTLGALSMAGNTAFRRNFAPLLSDFPHISPPYCYRCAYDMSYPSCQVKCARELERVILQRGPENVSVFIAEPVSGSSLPGVCPPPEYFPIIREICDKYDVLFLADEVMSGFGRTGKFFAIEHWGVVPDLLTFGKGATSGYNSFAGMIARKTIVEGLVSKNAGKFAHGHTYHGNPLSAAVGIAVLDYIEKHRLVERAAEMGVYLMDGLQELKKHPIVGDVRGKGLMAGIEFVKDKTTKEPFQPSAQIAERVTVRALDRGVVFYPGTGCVDGNAGDHILITPPLVVSRDDIDWIIDALAYAIERVEHEMGITG